MKRYTPFLFLALVIAVLFLSACSSPSQTAGVQYQSQPVYVPNLENLEDLQNSFRGLVQNVLPSVVRIDVTEISTVENTQTDPFYEFFFGQENTPDSREYRAEGLGSGVIVRRNGTSVYVLTNAHVIGEATEIMVTLDDGRQYEASLVGKDLRKDIALVSFETNDQDIAIAPLGNSDDLQVGDWVLAMGSPYGFQSTVTAGIVSALHRTGGPEGNISDFIQTDAAINRGNSGGALVNLNGEVIGINTWITTQTGGSVGIGFAIPINNVSRAIEDFIIAGEVRYGWLGVSIVSIDREIQSSLGVADLRGALVTSVYRSSPAGRGGLLPGDFIVSINDRRLESSDAVVLRVGELPVDSVAQIGVIRDGQSITIPVTIVTRESEDQIAGQSQDLWTGASVYPLTDDIRQQFGFSNNENGVIIDQITRRSPAAIAGLQTGDLITAVNGEAVSDLRSFFRTLNSRDSGDIEFELIRETIPLKITIVRR